MADIGTAFVQIVPKGSGLEGKISETLAPEATEAGEKAGEKISKSLGNRLSSLGGSMMKAGAIATAVSVPIVKGIKSAMKSYQVQNAAETKLTEIYKTRMGVSDKVAKKTMEVARALQRQGVVGDEVTLSGAQQLATFAKYPSTVNSLLPAMTNLLVQQKGLNGTAQDATQIANLMGKVMQGQTGALKRVGVSFTEAEEKVLKYGTEQEKAAMLAQVITNNVGNMNKAMLDTPEGKIQQMKNSFGDLAEKLGSTLAPALSDIAQWLSEKIIPKVDAFMSKMKGNSVFGKVIVGITGTLAAGGPLLVLLGGLTRGLGGFLTRSAGVGKLGTVFKLLGGPMGIIAGLVGAMMVKSESFRNAVIGLVKTVASAVIPVVKQIMPLVQQIMTAIGQLVTQIANVLAPVIKQLQPLFTTVITAVGQIVSSILTALIPVIQTLIPIISKILTVVAKVISKILQIVIPVVQKIMKVVTPIVQAIATHVSRLIINVLNTITRTMGRIKSVFSTVWGAIKTVVTGAVNRIKSVINGLKSIVTTIGNAFSRAKDAALRPVNAMKDKISSILAKIKGLFPLKVGKILDNIKLPRFTVTGKIPFGIGGKGEKPGIHVHWNAEGGIMDQPTLFGGGEAGPEAILPLDPFWRKLDKMTASASQPITINNYISVDGAEAPEQYAQRLFRTIETQWRTV